MKIETPKKHSNQRKEQKKIKYGNELEIFGYVLHCDRMSLLHCRRMEFLFSSCVMVIKSLPSEGIYEDCVRFMVFDGLKNVYLSMIAENMSILRSKMFDQFLEMCARETETKSLVSLFVCGQSENGRPLRHLIHIEHL